MSTVDVVDRHGPVVPPTTLQKPIQHFGTQGIEVFGRGLSLKLNYPKAG